MSLLFMDSFDHYDKASAKDKYVSVNAVSDIIPGRHLNGFQGIARCALNPTSNRIIVGGAYKFTSSPVSFFTIVDTNNTVGNLELNGTGGLEVHMYGPSAPFAATINDVIRFNQWHYIEFDFTITTSGAIPNVRYAMSSVKIIVDGFQVLNTVLGNSTTQSNTPSATNWNGVDLGWVNLIIDDFYICDGSGANFNAPLGDVRIDVIRPNGVGFVTEWTPVPGITPNWDLVNDIVPDDETGYVLATVAPKSDLYTMEDVNTGNTIIGAQILADARRTDEGFANASNLLRHAGVTTELPVRPLGSTYFYRNRDIFTTMPNGDPLSDANMNALQAGIKRTT